MVENTEAQRRKRPVQGHTRSQGQRWAQEESLRMLVPEPFSHLHHMPPSNSHWPSVLWLTLPQGTWGIDDTVVCGSHAGPLRQWARVAPRLLRDLGKVPSLPGLVLLLCEKDQVM